MYTPYHIDCLVVGAEGKASRAGGGQGDVAPVPAAAQRGLLASEHQVVVTHLQARENITQTRYSSCSYK